MMTEAFNVGKALEQTTVPMRPKSVEEAAEPEQPMQERPILQRLQSRRLLLETELSDVRAALDTLHNNPDMCRLLDLVCRGLGRI